MSSPFYLFKTRRFAPLFGTQFLGAFNDNLFKNTLAIVLTFQAQSWTDIPMSLLAPLVGAVFILPFFLFSGLAGELADHLDKAALARIVKIWELLLMILSLGGFYFHSFYLLMAVLFGMGMHSTLFGPIKYSIIPQHMHENELISANALVESGTFGAILLGTLMGGIFASFSNGGIIASIFAILFALNGYLFSRFIPTAPPSATEMQISLNPYALTLSSLRLAYQNKTVFLSILAISWFWLYGALLLSQFPAYVKTILKGDEHTVTILLALFTIGIGVGSILCEKLSSHTIRPSIIVIGAIGMGIAGCDFALSSMGETIHFWHVSVDLMLIGIFGGLYSVPLYAIMQHYSDANVRSRIIAANNILNALFMVSSSVAVMILLQIGWSIPDTFLAAAIGTGMVALVIYQKIKE